MQKMSRKITIRVPQGQYECLEYISKYASPRTTISDLYRKGADLLLDYLLQLKEGKEGKN